MRHHPKSNRQSRRYKGKDDDYYLNTQREEVGSETYTPAQEIAQRSESYKISSTSQHSSYDANRVASTSQNRTSESWRRREFDKCYLTNEEYGHHARSRGEHNHPEDRDLLDWSSQSQEDHRCSRSEFYDHGYFSSSYRELSKDEHSGKRLQRSEAEERHLERGSYDWRQDHRHKGLHKFRNRSGLESRRTRIWNAATRDPGSNDKDNFGQLNRSWEPAPSWRASNRRADNEKNREDRRDYIHWSSKVGKQESHHYKVKRDWRTDDGCLNNWTRRTGRHRTSYKKMHCQLSSYSRSRSHSPNSSQYSLCSWIRSRSDSASPSPKRRRRNATPSFRSRSRTPSDRGLEKRNYSVHHKRRTSLSPKRSPSHQLWRIPSDHGNSFTPFHRCRSSSPSPKETPEDIRGRRRSISSSCKSRSTSRSPPPARAVHRLPLKNSDISPSQTSPTINTFRKSGSKKNGLKPHLNGSPSQVVDKRRMGAASSAGSRDCMPPPSAIPTFNIRSLQPASPNSLSASLSELEHESCIVPITTVPDSVKRPAHFISMKQTTFKPISQTNSSLKKFFPGEEDDMEHDSRAKQPMTSRMISSQSCTSVSRDDDRSSGGAPDPEVLSVSFTESKDVCNPNIETLGVGDSQHSLQVLPVKDDPHSDEKTLTMSSSSTFRGDLYNIVSQVGEGTFGKVYKAQNSLTKFHVALKRIRMEAEKDGFPVTAMREIKLLQTLQHSNVVRLYEMMISNGFVYMVFEYMDHDLTGILSQSQFTFTAAHLKSLCHQMLSGLAYLHHKSVIHRDIKGSNILINNRGELKLADFGLARFYQKRRRSDYTNRVITLWYRPPELLFGATVYGPEVDMWSAGCIMLELFTRKPVFQGNDEIHQLEVVYKIIGTLTPERWLGVRDLPWYELIKPKELVANHFRELFRKWLSPAAIDLAEWLLSYDPSQRATANQALNAPYFTEEQPESCLPIGLATLEGEWHELETKRERVRRRRKIELAA